jgi:plasmid stabilization system protein ParE
MARYRLADAVHQDLDDIVSYIAEDSKSAADRVMIRIRDGFTL